MKLNKKTLGEIAKVITIVFYLRERFYLHIQESSQAGITSSALRWLPRKKYVQPIQKIEPISILRMGPAYFFLGNGRNTPSVIPALRLF